jgi:hypothetical protein
MNSNPSREALKKLWKSTKVILAVSRLRTGFEAFEAQNYPDIQEAESIFY